MRRSLLIGCVAENTPKYLGQALRLVQSVRWFGGEIAAADIMVCVLGEPPDDFLSTMENLGTFTKVVDPFDRRCPVTNKLRFIQQPETVHYGALFMLDCDTIVVRDPTVWLCGEKFRAKIADGPTMPHEAFERIFAEFRLPLPARGYSCTIRRTPTIPYFNTGVLFFPANTYQRLLPAWVRQTERLLLHFELIAGREHFCEQTGMSLAVAETATTFDLFGNEMNCPIHHPDHIPCLETVDPYVIHYHSMVDEEGFILPSRYPLINRRITEFNERLSRERTQR